MTRPMSRSDDASLINDRGGQRWRLPLTSAEIMRGALRGDYVSGVFGDDALMDPPDRIHAAAGLILGTGGHWGVTFEAIPAGATRNALVTLPLAEARAFLAQLEQAILAAEGAQARDLGSERRDAGEIDS